MRKFRSRGPILQFFSARNAPLWPPPSFIAPLNSTVKIDTKRLLSRPYPFSLKPNSISDGIPTVKPSELEYGNLKPQLASFEEKGRGEAIAFINWFLENIYRLDPVDADDCICDFSNDRGVDGIYIDHTLEEIQILQGKLKQKESSIGDAPLRDLAGTLTQFTSTETVEELLKGGGHADLKKLITRNNVIDLLEKGYSVVGIFISNQPIDGNGNEFAKSNQSIVVYDRNRIANEFVDIECDGGIEDSYTFDASYVTPMVITGARAVTYILPIRAKELVGMSGIDDGSLFSQNVRQSLGNTKVNKALRASVSDSSEHANFPLYHNGVNILCSDAHLDEKGQTLTIKNYVVVNGAQSITTFKRSSDCLTDDLRIIAKVIKISDSALSKKITVNSNNQNAIKPRDLKSTNEIQIRLREEFTHTEGGKYDFEIKRGQEPKPDSILITNEEAGRLLLAFDLMEPESCHQVYKLFDDKYSDIFGRPSVKPHRIIFLFNIMMKIEAATPGIEFKPLSKYGLTKFFLLSVISELMKSSKVGLAIHQNPRSLFESGRINQFLDAMQEVLGSLIVDLNYEVIDTGDQFDYKGDLKSPMKIRELRTKLLRSYEKDLARGKATSLDEMMA